MQKMESIRNFIQLTDYIATAGQPTAGQFQAIAEEGFGTVINLAMPEHPDSIANEGAIVAALGLTYIHIPVPFDDPKPMQVKRFCDYMKTLAGTRVFVHCILNYRVSAFMFHYLSKVAGLDEAASRSPMFSNWEPDETWQKLLSWDRDEIGL